jgi:hypothetical protein
VDQTTAGLLDDKAFSLLIPLLIPLWRVFVPHGTRGANLTRLALRQAILQEGKSTLHNMGQTTPRSLMRHYSSGAQPALTQIMIAEILQLSQTIPAQDRPSPDSQMLMISVLKAVIETLDHANRSR